MYVVAIEPATRAVMIGTRDELLGRGVVAREVNWLGAVPEVGAEVAVQIRHRARAVAGVVVRVSADEVEVALDEPASAISPGQSMVMYDGSRVLGGGVIERGRRELPVRGAA
jgi:tRNA-specific 2-thiouridylase